MSVRVQPTSTVCSTPRAGVDALSLRTGEASLKGRMARTSRSKMITPALRGVDLSLLSRAPPTRRFRSSTSVLRDSRANTRNAARDIRLQLVYKHPGKMSLVAGVQA